MAAKHVLNMAPLVVLIAVTSGSCYIAVSCCFIALNSLTEIVTKMAAKHVTSMAASFLLCLVVTSVSSATEIVTETTVRHVSSVIPLDFFYCRKSLQNHRCTNL